MISRSDTDETIELVIFATLRVEVDVITLLRIVLHFREQVFRVGVVLVVAHIHEVALLAAIFEPKSRTLAYWSCQNHHAVEMMRWTRLLDLYVFARSWQRKMKLKLLSERVAV